MGFREQLHSKREAAREDAEAAADGAGASGKSLFSRLKPAKSSKPEKPARAARAPIAAHKGFVPLIAGWGAALAGLTIAVLPASTITDITQTAQLTALGGSARIVLALLGALFGGLIAFAIARVWRGTVLPQQVYTSSYDAEYEPVRPIDPGAELGSESLDAPIEEELTEPANDAEEEPLDLSAVAEILPEDGIEQADEFVLENEFLAEPEAEIEDEPVKETAPALPEDAPDFLRGAALESLRRIPTGELSLMQMVERFAAALHAHQAIHGEGAQPRRDAALAEALRALSLFTEGEAEMAQIPAAAAVADDTHLDGTPSLGANGFSEKAQQTERELRDALVKLQKLSGAA